MPILMSREQRFLTTKPLQGLLTPRSRRGFGFPRHLNRLIVPRPPYSTPAPIGQNPNRRRGFRKSHHAFPAPSSAERSRQARPPRPLMHFTAEVAPSAQASGRQQTDRSTAQLEESRKIDNWRNPSRTCGPLGLIGRKEKAKQRTRRLFLVKCKSDLGATLLGVMRALRRVRQ